MTRLLVTACLIAFCSPVLSHADDGPRQSEEELLAGLSSSNYQVRRKAVLAVKGRTEPRLFERVLRMATSDRHPNIRGYTADVLSTFRDSRVFAVLENMASESSLGPANSAFVGLGRYGDARAYPILLLGLEAGRIRRGYAAKGLGLLGDARGFQPIAAMYRKHPDDPYLNDMAPTALVQLDPVRGLELCREYFLSLPAVARPGLAQELGRHPSDGTRDLMLTQLRTGKDASMSAQVISVLTKLADPQSADGLLQAFRDHPESRQAVAKALGRVGTTRAVAPLLDGLSKVAKAQTRNVYIEALGRIGDRRAVHALMQQLDNATFAPQPETTSRILGFPWNVETRGAALWAVRRIRDKAEPFALSALVTFPRRPLGPDFVTLIGDLKTWWAAHKNEKQYRLTSD